ncbi:MAG: hypothetical protein ABEN55_22780 [Bradymonadaceae bacterium]
MRGLSQRLFCAAVLIALGAPAVASGHEGPEGGGADVEQPDTSGNTGTSTSGGPDQNEPEDDVSVDQPDTSDNSSSSDDKAWTLSGSLQSRIGQGTFVGLENETGVEGEYQPNSAAYDRANLIYTLSPSYTLGEFTFGATFQLVQWLTPGGGTGAATSGIAANDPADTYFQDISISGSWKGHTFDSIGLNLAPSLNLSLPTSKASRLQKKILGLSGTLALSKTFFERLTFQASVSASKTFNRYTGPVIDPARVGEDNVLYRPGEAEDVGSGLVAIGGRSVSHTLTGAGAAQIKVVEKLNGSISYALVNAYTYPGNGRDEFSSEYARPNKNLTQIVSTSVNLSYSATDWLSVSGGIGSVMTPKTADNKSFRFPFWNFQGAAANRSWLQFGVSGKY